MVASSHRYVYGGVPPEAVAVAVAAATAIDTVGGEFTVMVMDAGSVQVPDVPLTVYVVVVVGVTTMLAVV
jgi:hypothetical protein